MMRNPSPFLPLLVAGIALAGCSKAKPTGADTTPAAAPGGPTAAAADLQVLGPTVAIDPQFTPELKPLLKPVDRPEVTTLNFSRDGSRLVVRSLHAENGLQVWNVGDRPTRARSWDRRGTGVLSPDGKRFLYTPEEHWAGVVADVDSGKTVTRMDALSGGEWAFASPDVLFGFHSFADPKRAAKSQIITADVATGKKTALFDIHEGTGFLRWSRPFADGRQVAVFWSHIPTIDVWDVLDRRRVRQVTPAVDQAHWSGGWYKVWVNPAGTRMASHVGWGTRAAGDTVARELAGVVVWDGQTGEAVALAQGQSVFYAGFLPGRDVFLMASNDLREQKREMSPEVVAFDYARKAYTAVFRGGHQAPITALDVTDDGRWLATGDKDGKVQLWDLRGLRQ